MSFKSNFTIPAVAAISFCSIGGTTPAYADIGDQLFKLLADDGATDDQFGVTVAISGATAIVGVPLDDDNGGGSGSAYLFDTTTGQQLFKLLPRDGAANDVFGVSVGISGEIGIVGASGNNDNGVGSGSAYLFDSTTGRQLLKLLPEDGAAGDGFGVSVAISGNTAIVGARGDGDNGALSGSAYLFDVTTGMQLFKLLPSDGAAGDQFGSSVAISGQIAIVGAPRNGPNGADSGSAYLFDVTTGEQIFGLLPDDGAAGDFFGNTVAISGTTAIVGAANNDANGANAGSAYLFDATTGVQIHQLLANDGATNDQFGRSVAISGATAIVGAVLNSDNGAFSGSAYLFDITTGQQLFKLLADDATAEDFFGVSVAISGGTSIVGAFGDDDNGADSGSAYLFDAGTPPCRRTSTATELSAHPTSSPSSPTGGRVRSSANLPVYRIGGDR